MSSGMAGRISAKQFLEMCREFQKVSEIIKDTWQLVNEKAGPEHTYLQKKTTLQFPQIEVEPRKPTDDHNFTVDDVGQADAGVEEQFDHCNLATDESSSASTELSHCVTVDYHIVYSLSYEVPVLYFNMYTKDGGLLSLEDVLSSIPVHYQQRLQAERWTFITQQEHPLLRRPYFQLHPCHTADLINTVSENSISFRNYLLTWLSAVGPVVHLTLPVAYAEHLAKR